MRGAELALKEANYTAGGKKIEIVKGSSDASPDSAVKAARKLVEQDGVKILIGPLSGRRGPRGQGLRQDQAERHLRQRHLGRAGHDLARSRAEFLPLLDRRRAMDGGPRRLRLQAARNTRRSSPSPRIIPSPTRRCSASWPSSARPAAMCRRSSGCRSATRIISSVIAAIPDDVDAIYVALGGADGVNFLTQYQQAGGQAPLIGGSITVDQTVLGTQGKQRDYIVGTPAAGPIADNADDAAVEEVRRRLQGRVQGRLPLALAVRAGLLHQHQGGAAGARQGQRRSLRRREEVPRRAVALDFDTPTGKVKLDKNRQAIADNYLTEVAKADDGHLYNKVIKVVHGVNQTLGIPEADFLKLGARQPRQPRLQVRSRASVAASERSGRSVFPAPASMRWSWKASAAASARWWRSPTSISRSAPASGERSSAPTAPARPRCSTPSPATSRRPPGASASSARTSPTSPSRSASGAACAAPIRSASCSAASPCSTASSSPAAASRAARLSLLRPRERDATMAQARTIAHLTHLDDILETPVAALSHGQQRQLEIALALSGAPRFILFDEPAAGLSPTERRDLVAHPQRAAGAYRLHHHRARSRRRAARLQLCHDDAQRPHLQGGLAERDRGGRRGSGALSRGRAWISAAAAARRSCRCRTCRSITASRTRCRACR